MIKIPYNSNWHLLPSIKSNKWFLSHLVLIVIDGISQYINLVFWYKRKYRLFELHFLPFILILRYGLIVSDGRRHFTGKKVQ